MVEFFGPLGPALILPVSMLCAVFLADGNVWDNYRWAIGLDGDNAGEKLLAGILLVPVGIIVIVGALLLLAVSLVVGVAKEAVIAVVAACKQFVVWVYDAAMAAIKSFTGAVKAAALKVGASIKAFVEAATDFLDDVVDGIADFFGLGGKKKKSAPLVEAFDVDTGRLVMAAERVKGVQRLLASVDSRLDRLRSNMDAGDPLDYLSSLSVDYTVGRDPQLDKISRYLSGTAVAFDDCEVRLTRTAIERFSM